MLKIVPVLILALMMACPPPIAVEKPSKVYVVNSLWQVVKTVDRSIASREIVGDDLTAEIVAYNSENIDDYLRVFVDTVPDIDLAPPVNVYVVNPTTYAVQSFAENITRRALVEDVELWKAEAEAQLLFIDHVPPPPIIQPPSSMYAFYALYVVNADGGIEYEDHCGYNADESFTGQWITDPNQGGWASVDAYFLTMLAAFMHEVQANAGWRLIEHEVYTP